MFLVGLFVSRGPWSIAGFAYAALAAYLVQGLFLDVLNRKYFWLVVGLALGLETVRGREQYRRGDTACTGGCRGKIQMSRSMLARSRPMRSRDCGGSDCVADLRRISGYRCFRVSVVLERFGPP